MSIDWDDLINTLAFMVDAERVSSEDGETITPKEAIKRELQPMRDEIARLENSEDKAWGLIANAYMGDWERGFRTPAGSRFPISTSWKQAAITNIWIDQH